MHAWPQHLRPAWLLLTGVLALLATTARAQPHPDHPTIKVPEDVKKHLDELRPFASQVDSEPHIALWKKSALICQQEGPDKCADVTLFFLNYLVGEESAKSPSRYRQLPRTKAPWVTYYNSIFIACPAKLKPGSGPGGFDPGSVKVSNSCRDQAAQKLVKSKSANTILRIDKAIGVSWTVFFDLPACMLIHQPGTCSGKTCELALNWHHDDCYYV